MGILYYSIYILYYFYVILYYSMYRLCVYVCLRVYVYKPLPPGVYPNANDKNISIYQYHYVRNTWEIIIGVKYYRNEINFFL
jgi:hypothetical protein